MLGDGYISDDPTPCLRCTTKYKNFASHLSEVFDNKVSSTSKKQYPEGKYYEFRTIALPDLFEFREWYSSGVKVFPKNLDLTPTTLKYWYVSDGWYCDTGTSNYIGIRCDKESGNEKKIISYFKEKDLPVPTLDTNDRLQLRWTVSESKILWDYMGSPPPAFEYKWSDEIRNS